MTVLDMTTYACIVVGFVLLVMPKFMSRFGTKQVYVVGAILGGIDYMLTPFSSSPIVLGIMIALGNLFSGMYCSIGTMVMVSKWFPRKKGTVMGIITAAGIVSSGVFLPLFNWFYSEMGITNAMLIFGGLMVVYGIVNIFWLKDTPQEVGLMPDNMPMTPEEEQELVASKHADSTWSYKQLLKSGKWWLVTLGWSIFFIGLFCLSLTSVSTLTTNGMDYNYAVAAVSFVGSITFISSIVSGILDTKIGVIKTTILVIAIMAGGMFIIGFGGSTVPVWLMVVGLIMALGLTGAPNNLFSSQILSMFGPKGYSTAYSMFLAFVNLKYLGNWICARSLAWTGGYNLAIVVGGICEVIGLFLIILAGQKKLPDPEPAKQVGV